MTQFLLSSNHYIPSSNPYSWLINIFSSMKNFHRLWPPYVQCMHLHILRPPVHCYRWSVSLYKANLLSHSIRFHSLSSTQRHCFTNPPPLHSPTLLTFCSLLDHSLQTCHFFGPVSNETETFWPYFPYQLLSCFFAPICGKTLKDLSILTISNYSFSPSFLKQSS